MDGMEFFLLIFGVISFGMAILEHMQYVSVCDELDVATKACKTYRRLSAQAAKPVKLTEVFVVQYHSNSWRDQEALDEVLGVYTNAEAAEKRAAEFKQKYMCDNDTICIIAYTLNKPEKSWLKHEEEEP